MHLLKNFHLTWDFNNSVILQGAKVDSLRLQAIHLQAIYLLAIRLQTIRLQDICILYPIVYISRVYCWSTSRLVYSLIVSN